MKRVHSVLPSHNFWDQAHNMHAVEMAHKERMRQRAMQRALVRGQLDQFKNGRKRKMRCG